MSLRVRVVLAIASVLLLGSLAGLGLAGLQARRVLGEELSAAMSGARQSVAGALSEALRSGPPGRDPQRLVATFDGDRHLRAAWVDAQGRVRAVSRAYPANPAPPWFASLLAAERRPERVSLSLPNGGALLLRPSDAADVGALWTEFVDLAAVLAASLLAGSAVLWLTVGRALRPLADFSRAFARIGLGDYATTVREEGPVELNRLGRQVNDMARRLGAMQAVNRALEEQLRTLQDEERADLARDLHDEMGPHLFAASVDATLARRLLGEGRVAEASDQIVAISASVTHLQGLVRDILGRLRPTELIDLGLAAAVAELVVFWQGRRPRIRFVVETPGDEDAVPETLRETVYRIVQEGLNNAVRHAEPTMVRVRIAAVASSSADAGSLTVTISDDGAAPRSAGPPSPGAGYGLIGMRERVAAAGGLLNFGRGEGSGWTLAARIPMPGGAIERRAATDIPAPAD